MKKITFLIFITFLFVFYNRTEAQTLTFSSDPGPAWDDGIVNDGDGGSTNIVGLTIEIYNVNDALNNLGEIEWYSNNDLGTTDGFSGLTTFFAPSVNDDWKGLFIKEANGLEFQINGFDWYDWGNNNSQPMTVLGFRDNNQVASTTFIGNSGGNSVSVSLDASFDNVDEVRIITTSGLTYPSINNIKFGNAVLSNKAHNHNNLKIYAHNKQFVSNNRKARLEIVNILGQNVDNENLKSGIYIVKVSLPNSDRVRVFKRVIK